MFLERSENVKKTGRERYDSMEGFCQVTLDQFSPRSNHKPTAVEILAYVLIGLVGGLILTYATFKYLQFKNDYKNEAINRAVNAFEYIPLKISSLCEKKT